MRETTSTMDGAEGVLTDAGKASVESTLSEITALRASIGIGGLAPLVSTISPFGSRVTARPGRRPCLTCRPEDREGISVRPFLNL